MAYATSSATNASGILDAIRLFAIDIGWTVNHWGTLSNGYWLSLEYDGMFFNFLSDDTNGQIFMKGSTAFSSSSSWYNQDDSYYSTYSSTAYAAQANDFLGGPFVGHHLFSDEENYIYCAVEVSSDRFTFVGFGRLNKVGDYTGGEFVVGTKWLLNNTSSSGNAYYSNNDHPFTGCSLTNGNCLIRVLDGYNQSALTNGWCHMSSSLSGDRVTGGVDVSNFLPNTLFLRGPSYINNVAPLIALPLWGKTSDNGSMVIGEPPDFRYVNMKYIEPGATLTYGSESWMVFPTKQKGEQITGDSTPFSHWHGIALRKID